MLELLRLCAESAASRPDYRRLGPAGATTAALRGASPHRRVGRHQPAEPPRVRPAAVLAPDTWTVTPMRTGTVRDHPYRGTMVTQPLDLRTLNRTLLARQLLLEPAEFGVEGAVAHLMGLQSQTPSSPYPGLWTRLAGFDFAELGKLLTERRLVRTVLMRNTVHLVTAEDALRLRPWLQAMFERTFRSSPWAPGAAAADPVELTAYGRALLAERPCTPAELREALGARFPTADPASLVHALRVRAPLVQLPPRGVWGASGGPVYALLDDWLGEPLAGDPDLPGLVRRYLAAFGPASAADMQKWCGVTGLKGAFAALDLRTYTAGDGRLLHDLPDAELADPAREIGARFVADFDNLLLSHADRTRVVPEEYRARVMTVNGIVRGTILVDGFVGGTWRFERAKGTAAVAVTPFARLRAADRAALTEQGARLLAASDPGAAHDVRFAAV